MRRFHLAVLVILIVGSTSWDNAAALQPELNGDPRMLRVEQWLKAIMQHEPGTTDQAAALVASWSARDVRMLWIDASVIAHLIRDPRRSSFTVKADGQRNTMPVRYSSGQLHRLKILGCAAGGLVLHQVCLEMGAPSLLDPDLLHLSRLVEAARSSGDDNFVFRRGALLHTDIAMFIPTTSEPVGGLNAAGPQRIRIETSDGLQTDLGQVAPHWELARLLLDFVKPPGASNPAPGLDEMVRLWYRATAAWMQAREQHDTLHLDRARAIFPKDADILFLSACQHEVYAGPPIQTVLQAAAVPYGVKSDVASERSELHLAETYFRRALAANPSMAEARLRFGRVLSLLDKQAEAVSELRQALTSTKDPSLKYDAALFLGAALEATHDFAAARDAYRQAAELMPNAQSAKIALSALARRRGDRAVAWREIQPLFERKPDLDSANDDPWWSYYVVQARNADQLLDELRRPFLSEASR